GVAAAGADRHAGGQEGDPDRAAARAGDRPRDLRYVDAEVGPGSWGPRGGADLPFVRWGRGAEQPRAAHYRPDGRVVALRDPPLGVLLRAFRGVQRALLLAHVAGDLLLGSEAVEHADDENGDDEEQQHARYERHALLSECAAATTGE